ncbi:MAG: thioredoxin [Propionibacteriaceae bacterium]|jgi:thioredoxin 1|nr:thioredoxin [Propionibacteriaceae bacterium]
MSVIVATDSTFALEVLESPLPVVVDFWAEWCAPCKQLAPILEELSDTYDGRVKFVSVNTEDNLQTMADNDIRSLPTVYVFSGGQLLESFIGAVPKSKLRAVLDSL